VSLQRVRDGLQTYQNDTLDPRPRIGFGLPALDDMLRGGLRKSQCGMIMAVSSVGKTSIGLNLVANNPDVPCCIFSIEMTWAGITSRLATIDTGTPDWELEGTMKAGGYPQQMSDTASRFPVLVGDDASEMSTKQMREAVDKASTMLGTPIRLVLIDYLELVSGAGLLGKAEQVDKVAAKVRALAKDTGTTVIVLHQVGKSDGGGGYKPLSLESGRYGGHQPMDAVWGAFAPRLNPDLKPAERDAVKEDLYIQTLKNRVTGRTNNDGHRFRLDRDTGRLSEWGQLVAASPARSYAAELPTHWSERDNDTFDPHEMEMV
jgi:hypothetical protein